MGKINKNKKKRYGAKSLRVKIVSVAVLPMLLMAIIIGFVATWNMSSGMKQEMMDALMAEAHSLESLYNAVNSEPYSVEGDKLMKGDFNVTDETDFMDSFVEGTGMCVTVFYGDTRMATTLKDKSGKRIIGTTADSGIVDMVTKKDKTVERYDLPINGEKYYACYEPLRQPDGTIVGMVFAGKSSKDAQKLIWRRTIAVVVVEVIMMFCAMFIVFLLTKGMQTGIRAAEKAVEGLSNGDLTTQIESKAIRRNDELGDMVKGVAVLLQQLLEVMHNIQESSNKLLQSGTELSHMAGQTSATADDISKAVEDISHGAVSQADEIDRASQEMDTMGQLIEHIANNVAELDRGTQEIKKSSDKSMEIIQDLSASNDRSMQAAKHISEQVNATNESALKIRAAVDLITSIAEETNLLSLNASIEAARAGEQGKGFAVVASQIQKLAEQSNESAGSIADTIGDLLKQSEYSVRIMDEVGGIMSEQQSNLEATKKQFMEVGQEVNEAAEAVGMIRNQTESCNKARANVMDVFTNLSAISEENAASTEETTASMEELNATISLLAGQAEQLQQLSHSLSENISFFQIGEGRIRESIHEKFQEASEEREESEESATSEENV